MHGHMMSWWRGRPEGGSGSGSGCGGWSCGPGDSRHWGGGRHHGGGEDESEGFGGGPFGVRRPLRFLAYKLELDEKQVAELARVLDDLKTERAQGEVDRRRSLSGFADAVAGPTFDAARAKESAALRVATAERLRDAVMAALGKLHALLDDDQRERLAYLIRTGVLTL
ncbi:MAG TPA: Spy/CpxP family protein refolding chaperone [Polyangia bacterium]